MARARTGYIFEDEGGYWVRVTFTDGQGKRRNIKRRAENRTRAKELLKQINRDLDDYGSKVVDGDQMSFADLADFYEKTYLIEPEYVDGRKVAGLRNNYDFKLRLNVLREFFGNRKLRSITHGDLERFKAVRIKTPVILGKNKKKKEEKPKTRQRSIATVHRDLSLLRRVLNIAVRNGWIIRNPFDMGDSLIKPGDEKPRERILTPEEESRLLAACTDQREHLRPILITLIDTGMRRGECLKLKWSDVDFEHRLLTVRALNSKTLRQRQVAMTERVFAELSQIYSRSTQQGDDLVFGITDNFSSSFNSARKAAGLLDVRIHDLRSTAGTRLIQYGVPIAEVAKVLGHSQLSTTYKYYVSANEETAYRAAEALNKFHAQEMIAKPKQVELVN